MEKLVVEEGEKSLNAEKNFWSKEKNQQQT